MARTAELRERVSPPRDIPELRFVSRKHAAFSPLTYLGVELDGVLCEESGPFPGTPRRSIHWDNWAEWQVEEHPIDDKNTRGTIRKRAKYGVVGAGMARDAAACDSEVETFARNGKGRDRNFQAQGKTEGTFHAGGCRARAHPDENFHEEDSGSVEPQGF